MADPPLLPSQPRSLLMPIFVLGPVYARENTLSGLGPWLYLQLAMFLIEAVLAFRYRIIYRGHLLKTRAGDELLIFRDPEIPNRADAFVADLKVNAFEPESPAT